MSGSPMDPAVGQIDVEPRLGGTHPFLGSEKLGTPTDGFWCVMIHCPSYLSVRLARLASIGGTSVG